MKNLKIGDMVLCNHYSLGWKGQICRVSYVGPEWISAVRLSDEMSGDFRITENYLGLLPKRDVLEDKRNRNSAEIARLAAENTALEVTIRELPRTSPFKCYAVIDSVTGLCHSKHDEPYKAMNNYNALIARYPNITIITLLEVVDGSVS